MLVAVRSFVYVSTMNIVLRVVFRVANAPEVSALCKSCAISVPWKTIFASLYQKWRKFSDPFKTLFLTPSRQLLRYLHLEANWRPRWCHYTRRTRPHHCRNIRWSLAIIIQIQIQIQKAPLEKIPYPPDRHYTTRYLQSPRLTALMTEFNPAGSNSVLTQLQQSVRFRFLVLEATSEVTIQAQS